MIVERLSAWLIIETIKKWGLPLGSKTQIWDLIEVYSEKFTHSGLLPLFPSINLSPFYDSLHVEEEAIFLTLLAAFHHVVGGKNSGAASAEFGFDVAVKF